ncbi:MULTISPECIES: hypothetical protein [Serratia]|uniref:hypothetical protein n=1 Tax=Serratia TaxID=613 RepID=UPI001180A91E|nr:MULTISPECIES: hypothetical protein [Serratia]TSB25975.1 hypothetical protein FOT43_22055 [Serratia marcescens]TXE48069.1 hypothetical protein FOT60_05090 [Serratia marcescens]CAI1162514.1 Uncharacterised protein [Serratia ficaria]CAI1169410.1 Uncharacterised protein [Serratia ficaria]CAI1973954.1 Uncharacterised protein [Serratia ficaria]
MTALLYSNIFPIFLRQTRHLLKFSHSIRHQHGTGSHGVLSEGLVVEHEGVLTIARVTFIFDVSRTAARNYV